MTFTTIIISSSSKFRQQEKENIEIAAHVKVIDKEREVLSKDLDKANKALADTTEDLIEANEKKKEFESSLSEKEEEISKLKQAIESQAKLKEDLEKETINESSEVPSKDVTFDEKQAIKDAVSKREAMPTVASRGGSSSKLGTFSSTAYCNCTICCGPNAQGKTASGTTPQAGRTIAVDPNIIPLGSKVLVNGKQYIAEDTGSAVKGKVVDVYFDSHQQALAWGRKPVNVEVL